MHTSTRPTQDSVTFAVDHSGTEKLNKTGIFIVRYGLVFVLLLWGAAKWTQAEAVGIQPLVAHSPFLFWIYQFMSVQQGSEFIGCIELALAALIAVRRWAPRTSAIGSIGTIFMFLTTLSSLLTTPKLDGATQGFLIKDIFLLGAAVLTAGEAWAVIAKQTIRMETSRRFSQRRDGC
jgi:reactive chlorine resistance protein C